MIIDHILMNSREELLIPANYDDDDFILEPLTTLETKNGPMTRSQIRRIYDDGEPGLFLAGLPNQFCFGLAKKYKFKLERIIENWTREYQLNYSATSLDTRDDHTELEQHLFDMCENMEKKLAKYIVENHRSLGGMFEAFGKDLKKIGRAHV